MYSILHLQLLLNLISGIEFAKNAQHLCVIVSDLIFDPQSVRCLIDDWYDFLAGRRTENVLKSEKLESLESTFSVDDVIFHTNFYKNFHKDTGNHDDIFCTILIVQSSSIVTSKQNITWYTCGRTDRKNLNRDN